MAGYGELCRGSGGIEYDRSVSSINNFKYKQLDEMGILMDSEFLSADELKKWRESNYLKIRCSSEEAFKRYVSSIENVKKAPSTMNIEIWSWHKECYKCKKFTSVVFPVGEIFGDSVDYYSLTHLPKLLADNYPCYRNNIQNFTNPDTYANACLHCGAYQGNFYIMEDYLEIAYDPEAADIKTLTIPLTEEERIFFGTPVK